LKGIGLWSQKDDGRNGQNAEWPFFVERDGGFDFGRINGSSVVFGLLP